MEFLLKISDDYDDVACDDYVDDNTMLMIFFHVTCLYSFFSTITTTLPTIEEREGGKGFSVCV